MEKCGVHGRAWPAEVRCASVLCALRFSPGEDVVEGSGPIERGSAICCHFAKQSREQRGRRQVAFSSMASPLWCTPFDLVVILSRPATDCTQSRASERAAQPPPCPRCALPRPAAVQILVPTPLAPKRRRCPARPFVLIHRRLIPHPPSSTGHSPTLRRAVPDRGRLSLSPPSARATLSR